MDEQFEQGFFSDFQKNELNEGYLFSPLFQLRTPRLSQQKSQMQIINLEYQQKGLQMSQQQRVQMCSQKVQEQHFRVKAYNPLQMVNKMPQDKRKQYLRIANNTKNFSGLQFFFQTQSPQQQTFLSGMNQMVFNTQHEPKSGDLDKLFSTEQYHQTQKEHIDKIIQQMKSKMNQSQERNFNSIMINKTIGTAFYQHFQNFSFVCNPNTLIQDIELNLTNFIAHARRQKGPGYDLIYSIYDFWMRTFKDFVNQIWKYSSKFTLNCFKKQKNSQISQISEKSDHSSDVRSLTKQSKQGKQRRKNWSSDQIRILQKIIQSNIIFSQSKLKQLAQQLNRSTNSISSKLQKLCKLQKGSQYQQQSLLKKTIQVLKLSPQGLTKDSIIEAINYYYQMGYDGQWEKSVGQLLSGRKEFHKVKGKYKLIPNNQILNKHKIDEDTDKMTFRDKIIRCFLKFQNHQAQLKQLIEMYIHLFGQYETSNLDNDQRRKSIEASISKTLSRYDIFDSTNSKTIYQYIQSDGDKSPMNFEQSFHNFMSL